MYQAPCNDGFYAASASSQRWADVSIVCANLLPFDSVLRNFREIRFASESPSSTSGISQELTQSALLGPAAFVPFPLSLSYPAGLTSRSLAVKETFALLFSQLLADSLI